MVFAVLTVLFFSFMFSGTEAALLSLPAGEKLSPAAQRVSEAMKSTLCSLVLGNNLANIAGSIALGQLATSELPAWAQGVFPWVFTALVIIFGEIIPKAIGEARSAQVIGIMANVLLALNWVFAPVNVGFEFILKYLPQKEVLEDEEELVEAARSLDTTPVSEIMGLLEKDGPDISEWAAIVSTTPGDIAIRILHDEGPQRVINERGHTVGYLDKYIAFEWLFDHLD